MDDNHGSPTGTRAPSKLLRWAALGWVLFVYLHYYVQWGSCFLGGGYLERYMKLILGG